MSTRIFIKYSSVLMRASGTYIINGMLILINSMLILINGILIFLVYFLTDEKYFNYSMQTAFLGLEGLSGQWH